jgi:hypothetical protein
VDFPFAVDVIFSDKVKKSTGVHAKILAPEQVRICQFPEGVPAYDRDTTVLVYPSEDATTLPAMSLEQLRGVKRVVLVDSSWEKSKKIMRHQSVQSLPCVKLAAPPTSRFWRYHTEVALAAPPPPRARTQPRHAPVRYG